ncbi:MAG: sigma-70 family RNA polymerase sigma factor [Candidatus Aminicenantes bacterium]|nr:sigma-70 family RNA polymerase sigma factor [Candidatus Aminicenantes bacterium]NIN86719.1 sigma-70 family RNA polymerase sigma factor [Candidatus Aminicenantes bacterium]
MELVMNSDTYLVKRACGGESGAFEQIVELNKKKVFYLAFDLTGSREDAEDLSQEVFLKAFRSLKKFKGDASLSSWLYRITLNAFLDRKRKLSFRKEREYQPLEEVKEITAGSPFEEDETVPDRSTAAGPENYAESRQIQMHIEAALAYLTPRERAVFVMRHYREMPGKKVGQLLNISEGTVKSLLFRAVKKLQPLLKDYNEAHGSRGKEVYQ